MESTPALEVRRATKVHPGNVVALDGVSLAVDRASTVALVGESGAGKTTLVRLFNALEQPTSGEVHVDGRPIEQLDPIALRRHTGYVQQSGGLLPHWTVNANVGLVPDLLGWSRRTIDERCREVLDLVGLDRATFGGRYPAELSGGQRQRVAVARALAADPDVVLLDEPFGALDALTRRDLQATFADLRVRLAKTMVLVTHDLNEASRLADRVAVLRSGRILQVGPVDELRDHPVHDYVRELVRRGLAECSP